MSHTFLGDQQLKGGFVGCGDVVVHDVGDAVVVERTQHLGFEGLTETNLVGHVVVEELEDVETIRSFGGRGHSKKEPRIETLDDALVGGRSCAVRLVNDDVFEGIVGERGESSFLGQGLNGREDEASIRLLA